MTRRFSRLGVVGVSTSIVAEFTARADDFALGDALAAHPDVRIESEKVVPTWTEVLPFFWTWGGDFDAFVETVLDLSPTAVSGRMRRGQAKHVARSLATDT